LFRILFSGLLTFLIVCGFFQRMRTSEVNPRAELERQAHALVAAMDPAPDPMYLAYLLEYVMRGGRIST
jgi:hypothetical protein